jgi:hypothetical protein
MAFPEDCGPVMSPEIVEGLSLERSLVDNALGLWSIDHLP